MTSGPEPEGSSTGHQATEEDKKRAEHQPGEQSAAPPSGDGSPSGETDGEGEDDLARCPICQFIEAGECKEPHQAWTACRKEAKAAGKDYIDECQDHFKAFLQCALDHRDYYEPFLEMLGGLTDEEEGREEAEGAAEAANAAAGPSKTEPAKQGQ